MPPMQRSHSPPAAEDYLQQPSCAAVDISNGLLPSWPHRKSRSRVPWTEGQERLLLKAVYAVVSTPDFDTSSLSSTMILFLGNQFTRMQILCKIKELKLRYSDSRREYGRRFDGGGGGGGGGKGFAADQKDMYEICDKVWGNPGN